MIEILNFIVGLVFTIFAFLFMIGSAVLVHEKKQRQKALQLSAALSAL